MKKFKLMFDKTKETDWLNSMAAQGWNLTDFALGLYTFQPCKPGEYVYEADLKDKGLSISPEYRSILESQQIEIIPSTSFWFLVRRKSDLGPLELYTDPESRIEQYKRIRKMFKAATLIELLCLMLEIYAFARSGNWYILAVVILLGLVTITLFQALASTNRKIAQLEGREDKESKQLMLAGGMFLISSSLLIRPLSPNFGLALGIAGIAVMIYLLFKAGSKR